MLWTVFACVTAAILGVLLWPLLKGMPQSRAARRTAAIVIALIVPVSAALLYASLGNPALPGQPYGERLKHDPAVILADTAAKMEAAAAADPSIAGYRTLSRFYLETGDLTHAAAVQKRAMELGADSATDWSDLGEIRMMAAGGRISPETLTAFAEALKRDRREPRARFYAGLAEAQAGKPRIAVAIWRDLERESKDDAPWLAGLRREIAAAAKTGKFDPAAIAPTAPSPGSIYATAGAMRKEK